jgi:predicted membrane metal-binding protein
VFGKAIRWKVPRTTLVCAACLAFFAGVALARSVVLGDARWIWALLPAVLLALRRRSFFTLAMVAVLFFGGGWWRGSGMVRQLVPYQQLSRRSVVVVGRAAQDGVYGTRYQTTFAMDHARTVAPVQTRLPGGLNIAGFGVPAVYRGDEVQVSGKLFPTRGNNQASINFAELTMLRHNSSWINTFRRKFAAGMQSALPEPLASFGLGLLIGQRNTLPEDISHMLLAVGLMHIIAVSGL